MAKILLVEDDNNLREIYEARLQAEGYTIVSANDGEQALVVAKNEQPDLVISDVMMPKISGFEMLDILRNTDGLKDVKVIMLTALGQSEDKTRADQLGANKYLVKSQVTLEDIVKTAHQLLDDEPASVAAPPAASDPVTPAPAPQIPAADSAATPTDPVPTPTANSQAPGAEPTDSPAVAAADPASSTPMATPSTQVSADSTTTTNGGTPDEPAASISSATSSPVLPDPDAVDPRKDDDPANDPLSTAEETAAMQARINEFEAQPSAPPTAVEPADPSSEVTDNAQANDTTMASAVDSLSSSSTSQQRPSEVTAVEVPPTTPSEASQPAAATPPAASEDSGSDSDSLTMNRKRIIKPLNTAGEKKDINQLLAEEMAKSESPADAVAPSASQTDENPPPPAPNTDAPDPNSVAL